MDTVEFSAVGFLSWARRFGVKASKFTDAQKAFVIKQGDEGTPVADIYRKAGISQATYFNWKKKYAGLLPSEMRRLRELVDGLLANSASETSPPDLSKAENSRPTWSKVG
jgi:putative transposase